MSIISLPENIGKYLIKEENVLCSGSGVIIDGERGFNFAVTNKRIIFAKKRKMHEVRHDHISSISWERRHRWWFILIGLILVIIGGYLFLDNLDGYGGETPIAIGGIMVLAGALLILAAFFCAQEYLAIYSSGRKLEVIGKREILEELIRISLEIVKK